MDYLKEVNAFYDWLETNPVDASTQTLWSHLMMIANKSGWPEWFAVTNPLLQAKVGISENSLAKHRNHLVQKGRIEYKSQGKKQAGKYKIIPFTSNIESIRGVNREAIRVVTGGAKGSAYIDLSSLNSSATASAVRGEYESFYKAHKRVFGFDCNPYQSETLGVYIDQDGIDEAVVVRAIERAAIKGKGYRFGLITKILDDYFKSGVTTLEQAEAVDAAFESSSSQNSTNTQPINRNQKQLNDLEQFIQEGRASGGH